MLLLFIESAQLPCDDDEFGVDCRWTDAFKRLSSQSIRLSDQAISINWWSNNS